MKSNFKKNKNDKFKTNVVKSEVVSQTIDDMKAQNKVYKDIGILYDSFNQIYLKLKLYNDYFSIINKNQNFLISKLKNEFDRLLYNQLSLVDIYYFLKSKHISKYYINKLINVEDLLNYIEIFLLKYDLEKYSFTELKKEFLNQKWRYKFYIHKLDNNFIKKLFYIMKTYNFYIDGKDKIYFLLLSEFKKGIKDYKTENLQELYKKESLLEDINILIHSMKKNINIFNQLYMEILDFENIIKRSGIENYQIIYLLEITDKLKKEIYELK